MRRLGCITWAARLCLITTTVLATNGAIQTLAQNSQPNEPVHQREAYSGPAFRYAIIYDDARPLKSSREITILMDPSQFSENNLRTLFLLLSERFKRIPTYTAFIETSLEDIQTPEEHEGPGYSESPNNPKAFQHPSAMIEHSPHADTLYIFLPSRATQHPIKIDLRTPLAK
jgi:hypothetical protein